MINTNVLAIDLAKNSFQVCKTDKFGRVIFNKALSRKQLLILLANEKQSFVAMESCGGTHYWCRKAKGPARGDRRHWQHVSRFRRAVGSTWHARRARTLPLHVLRGRVGAGKGGPTALGGALRIAPQQRD